MTIRTGTIALLLFLCGFSLYAAPCDINPAGPAQRVFAQVDAHHPWAEFKSIDVVPQLTPGEGVSAEVWDESDRSMLVKTSAPARNMEAYTKYCYSRGGYLDSIQFELRTDWGWYYKAEGPFVMNRFHRSTEQYFDSKSDQPLVVRPQQPDDFPQILIPLLYKRANALPFANLLEKRP
ncbi:MAG: hypothetical protein ABR928_06765 [Terracidiphilus sp.]|jgi:hypothetical protein